MHLKLLIVVSVLSSYSVQGLIFADGDNNNKPTDGVAVAGRFWNELKDMPGKHVQPSSEEFWSEYSATRQACFDRYLVAIDTDELSDAFSETIVQKFSQGDCVLDAKWMNSMERYLMTTGFPNPVSGLCDGTRPIDINARRLQLSLAKAMVERFAEDRQALARYQHYLSWRRKWLDGYSDEVSNRFFDEFGRVRDRFEPGAATYWWDARNFMVIAFTTGRSDLIPSEVDELATIHVLAKEWEE